MDVENAINDSNRVCVSERVSECVALWIAIYPIYMGVTHANLEIFRRGEKIRFSCFVFQHAYSQHVSC
jgi:hypothetical protein